MSELIFGHATNRFKSGKDKMKDEEYYICKFCGFEFWYYVGTSAGDKHSKVSTQVTCPNCRNMIPTYEKYGE